MQFQGAGGQKGRGRGALVFPPRGGGGGFGRKSGAAWVQILPVVSLTFRTEQNRTTGRAEALFDMSFFSGVEIRGPAWLLGPSWPGGEASPPARVREGGVPSAKRPSTDRRAGARGA